jgi:peptidyl-prolyl cis-trans isomerase SurA
MMLRRSFAPALLALAGLGSSFAQTAQPAAPGDGLNLRFANGIAAVAEDKVITVDDIRRVIGQYIPQLQKEARNEKEFNDKLEALQDSVIQDQIDRVLIIKEFYKEKDGKEARHIPASFVDNRIAEIQSEQFDNDRSKFLAYLRGRGLTNREYRREVEEDIIYQYMQGQQRRSQSVVSPVRIETFYRENKDQFYQEDKVHLRLIQLSRSNGETDAELRTLAEGLVARMRAGEKFEDLAKEYSKDVRRAKGGDWGWQQRSDVKEEFRTPVFALKKGEVTDPVVLPEGCYLLYAEDRKYAGIQPIDEVRDQIERVLLSQMSRSSQERWLERLRRNGYTKHY